MRASLSSLPAAVVMLTRVPAGSLRHFDAAAAAVWFPIVGAATGAAVAGVLLAAGSVLPAAGAALLAVAFELAVTGALHLDGLADTADGAGGRDPDERLRIMRDHAIGVYGVAALVLSLGLRSACLAALLVLPLEPVAVVALLACAWALSRTALLVPALALPYARHSGTGRTLVEGLTKPVAGLGILVVAVLCALPPLVDAGLWRAVLAGVLGIAASTAYLTWWAATRIGGVTGDVLGAVAEAGLVAALVAQTAALGGPST